MARCITSGRLIVQPLITGSSGVELVLIHALTINGTHDLLPRSTSWVFILSKSENTVCFDITGGRSRSMGRHARPLSTDVTLQVDAHISSNFFHFSHFYLITGSTAAYFT